MKMLIYLFIPQNTFGGLQCALGPKTTFGFIGLNSRMDSLWNGYSTNDILSGGTSFAFNSHEVQFIVKFLMVHIRQISY